MFRMSMKVKILGVSFGSVTMEEALEKVKEIFDKLRAGEKGKQVVTPNPEMLLLAQQDKEFMHVLNSAYLSVPDGIGILWAARYIHKKKVLPERVAGVDLMEHIVEASRHFQGKIFLLGAGEGIAQKVKEKFEKKYPGVKIVGVYSGSPREDEFIHIKSLIVKTEPNILFVAFGQKTQELWIHKHLHEFPSVKLAMGVGGAFDFISGHRKRAPKWMHSLALEWLFRLIQEPSRIKRIWNATIKFPIKVLKNR